MSAGAKLFRVVVPVSDLALAIQFYSRLLGHEGRRVSPGRHYFDCLGVTLCVYEPQADGDPAPVSPLPTPLYFEVSDLPACFARASALVPSVDAIAKRPWGEESFYLQDPFGNRLCFVRAETRFSGEFFVE